jgi:hypothetical protein
MFCIKFNTGFLPTLSKAKTYQERTTGLTLKLLKITEAKRLIMSILVGNRYTSPLPSKNNQNCAVHEI